MEAAPAPAPPSQPESPGCPPRPELHLTQIPTLTLLPQQKEHVERILRILQNPMYGYWYVDTSQMGCGKTYIHAYLAKVLKKAPLVVCPKTVKSVWKEVFETYHIPYVAILGYGELRSNGKVNPKHGLLALTGHDKPMFQPTQKLVDLLRQYNPIDDRGRPTGREGVFLVADEGHKTKNPTITTSAVSCLATSIIQYSPISRIALLTGSLYDNEKNAFNIMRAMGLVNDFKVGQVNIATGRFEGRGVLQAIAIAQRIDLYKTNSILQTFPPMEEWKNADALKMCHLLYVGVIKKGVSSAMPKLEIKHHIYDGFFSMNQQDTDSLNRALLKLKEVAQTKDGEIKFGGKVLGAVLAAHEAVQISKVPIFYRLIKTILRRVPGARIICAFQYKTPIHDLQTLLERDAELKELGIECLIFIGNIKDEKMRAEILRKFNNEPKSRILLMTSSIGSLGISAHDTRGGEPRFLLGAPTYDLIGSFQLIHRVIRTGSLSIPTVINVYCNNSDIESEEHILLKLVPKGDILRSTMQEHMQDIKLPGTYPRYIETEETFGGDLTYTPEEGTLLPTIPLPTQVIPE